MRLIAPWALVSSGCAPVVLIGGWLVAGFLDGIPYDPATQTISYLEAGDTASSWVMTTTLAALGTCHLVTAAGLRPAALPGRLALAAGGVASILVALFPPPEHGPSFRHGLAAGTGYALLAAWPILATRYRRPAPWALHLAPAVLVTLAMLAGAAWFMIEIQHHGLAGVPERLVTSVQAAWPLVVALSCVRHARTAAAGRAP